MKRFITFIILLALALSLSGCRGGSYHSGEGDISIVTSSFPAYDFARELVGEKGRVCLLVPPGSESHSYEPTAKDIQNIQDCDVLIYNGGVAETWLSHVLDVAEECSWRISMLSCVAVLEEEVMEGMQVAPHDHDEHEGHEQEAEYDEHVWTSPRNAALIAGEITKALCAVSPEDEEYFRQRHDSYVEKLLELDRQFREVVEASSRQSLIFADRFPVRYFVEEYGLDYYAAFPGCAEEAEPSARTVAFLIDKVREEQVPAVFYIEFSNQQMADVICQDTGCKKLLFHSCHNVTREQLEEGISYLQLMEGNLESLREALS